MISVLIPTLNEAHNIVDCVQSVRWSDDIVVIDSGSTDGTQQLAAGLGAVVVEFKWNGKVPKKKNWALQNVPWKHDWVLVLDADERVPEDLGAEMRKEVQWPRADGYFINRRFLFLGAWLRHCGYYPSWDLRLFRHQKGRYETLHPGDTRSGDNEVHEHIVLDGTTAFLTGELLHLAYPDIFTWMEKHNRYSNWEAEIEVGACRARHDARQLSPELAGRRRLRNRSRHWPFRPTLRFLYSYVVKRGFLDGYPGYVFCRLLAAYEMLSVFKARELRSKLQRNS